MPQTHAELLGGPNNGDRVPITGDIRYEPIRPARAFIADGAPPSTVAVRTRCYRLCRNTLGELVYVLQNDEGPAEAGPRP